MSSETDEIIAKKSELEKIVSLAGYGWFSYKLVFICGWVVASDAIEILSVSYILPAATCDMNLNDQKKGWINASIFIGMTFGAFTCSSLADVLGRRFILIFTLFCNGFFNLASGLARNYFVFCVFRVLSGVGVGGNISVVYTYITEFQPLEHRGKIIMIVSSFWALGGIIAGALAWLIIPINSNWILSPQYSLRSWNLYLCLCSIPVLLCACIFLFMPESPKYLLEFSKIDDLKKLMKNIFVQNNPEKDANDYEKKCFNLDVKSNNEIKYSKIDKFTKTISLVFKNWGQLLSKERICTTLKMVAIASVHTFCYYGMFMWFPEFFKRIESNSGSICMNKVSSNPVEVSCNVSTVVYMQGILVMVSNFFGYTITILCIDNIGRKFVLGFLSTSAAISIFLFWFLSTSTQVHLASYFYGAIASAIGGVISIIIMEAFPTNIRSSTYGLCSGISRITSATSNLIIGYLLNVYCFLPFLLISTLYVVNSVIACFLKETKNMEIN